MPKRRDYKAEYARRIERARLKAVREGVEFDKSKARGHKGREYERQRERERRAVKRAGGAPVVAVPKLTELESWIIRTAYGVPVDEYRAIVHGAIDTLASDGTTRVQARRWMIRRLKRKHADTEAFIAQVRVGRTQEQAAAETEGRYNYFTGRLEFMPVEVYWYHGGGYR